MTDARMIYRDPNLKPTIRELEDILNDTNRDYNVVIEPDGGISAIPTVQMRLLNAALAFDAIIAEFPDDPTCWQRDLETFSDACDDYRKACAQRATRPPEVRDGD